MRYIENLEKNPRITTLLIITVIIVIDQSTKILTQGYLRVICNEGFGLGIQIGKGITPYFSFIILTYLLYITFSDKSRGLYFPLALILGGGTSNLIDRLLLGCVRDFINVGILSSFNLADIAISCGVIVYLVMLLRKRKNAA